MSASEGMVATVRRIRDRESYSADECRTAIGRTVRDAAKRKHWRRSETAMLLAAWDDAIRQVYEVK